MTLFVSDLDGTLLDNSAKIKPRTIDMLNSMLEKGLLFTYATARSFRTAEPITKELKLSLPVILLNGTFIYDFKNDKYIAKNLFNNENISVLKEFVIKHSEYALVHAFIDGKEKISWYKINSAVLRFINNHANDDKLRKCSNYDELFEGEIFFVTLLNPNAGKETADSIFDGTNGFSTAAYYDTYNPDDLWYEIFPENAGKANAVKQLAQYLGADKTVCFGDNRNDLEMLRSASISVAVANADAEVINAASELTFSNLAFGVPCFIEKVFYQKRAYNYPETMIVESDADKFRRAIDTGKQSVSGTIGTLNEKLTHAALKNYFSNGFDQEVKIGAYIADAVGENGIYEIQTANFEKLTDKLSVMLEISHVTVVYPFAKRVSSNFYNDETGELLHTNVFNCKSMTNFFHELYQIKAFLTNPNLSVCIAEIEYIKNIAGYIDKNGKTGKKKNSATEKIPVNLMSEIYLRSPKDYRFFLPNDLPEVFTKANFSKHCKIGDASIILSILQFVHVVEICGKKGAAFLYRAVPENEVELNLKGNEYDNIL